MKQRYSTLIVVVMSVFCVSLADAAMKTKDDWIAMLYQALDGRKPPHEIEAMVNELHSKDGWILEADDAANLGFISGLVGTRQDEFATYILTNCHRISPKNANSLLLAATKSDCVRVVQHLIEVHNLPVDTVNTNNGLSILDEALNGGSFDVAKYLIDKGAKLTTTGFLPSLHRAIMVVKTSGDESIIRYILDNSKDLDLAVVDKVYHANVLIFAISQGRSVELIRKIVEKAPDLLNSLSRKDLDNRTPLHEAIITGRADIIKELLTRKELDLSIKDGIGFTPVECAKHLPTSAKQTLHTALSKTDGAAQQLVEVLQVTGSGLEELRERAANPSEGDVRDDPALSITPPPGVKTTTDEVLPQASDKDSGSRTEQEAGNNDVTMSPGDQPRSSGNDLQQAGGNETQGSASFSPEAKRVLGAIIGVSAIIVVGYAFKRMMATPKEPVEGHEDKD